MIVVVCCGLVAAVIWPQCIACCNCSSVVGCANPLPNHYVEKAGSRDPKFCLKQKGRKISSRMLNM